MFINTEELDLQPSLVEIVDVLNANHPNYVSTLDFLKCGVLSPAAGIARLKKKGVLIDKITKTIVDESGKSHKRIAFYTIVGVI